MLPDYSDIKDRIKEEPKWYTEHGVPRYCDFNPIDHSQNIYADTAVLYKITCQRCGKEFIVADSDSRYDVVLKKTKAKRLLRNSYKDLHYGDPPNHGCVGDTMNCEDIEIVEFWQQDGRHNWHRVPEKEIKLQDWKEGE